MMQRVVRVRGSSSSYCVYIQPTARGEEPRTELCVSAVGWLVCSWSTEEYRVVRTSWLREIQNRFRVRFGEYRAMQLLPLRLLQSVGAGNRSVLLLLSRDFVRIS
jgi:hypothetical protein